MTPIKFIIIILIIIFQICLINKTRIKNTVFEVIKTNESIMNEYQSNTVNLNKTNLITTYNSPEQTIQYVLAGIFSILFLIF